MSLQWLIEVKYHLRDKILVEGMFVTTAGTDCVGNCLVKLGLSEQCLFIASPILSGTEIDYNITSVIPMSLLSFSVDDQSMTITISNVLNEVQTYQLCTSVQQSEIWHLITSFSNQHGNTLRKTCSKHSKLSVTTCNVSESDGVYSCGSSPEEQKVTTVHVSDKREYLTVPSIHGSESDSYSPVVSRERRISSFNSDCLIDITFEQFVNDLQKDKDNNDNVTSGELEASNTSRKRRSKSVKHLEHSAGKDKARKSNMLQKMCWFLCAQITWLCFLEKKTLPSLYSTGWFQERV